MRQPRQGTACNDHSAADGDHRCLERVRRRDPHGHRQPDRCELRAPDRGRNDPGHRSSPDQGRRRRLRPHDLRPGVHEHGVVSKRDHLPRRRQRASCATAATPSSSSPRSSSFLEVAYLLVYGELPTQPQLDAWVHEITHHTFVHENVRRFMQGFRYDAHPMGMLQSSVGVLSTFYPEAKDIDGRRDQRPADRPPDRQDADPRRLGLPAHHGQAVRLPEQRALLLGELPLDAVHHRRAEVRRRTRASSRRSTCSSSCTPITSRTARPARYAAWARRRSTRTRPSRPASAPSTDRCTAAPTRPCCRCSAASRRWTTSRPSSRASRAARSA